MDEKNEINPFYHRPNWTLTEILKIFISTFTIFPLKLLLLGVIFIFLYPSVVIAYWFGSRNSHCDRKLSESTILLSSKPFSGTIYKTLLGWIDILDRALLWVAGFIHIDIVGIPCKDTQILVCAPHSTFADSVVVMTPKLKSIVAKRAAGKIPVLGTLVSFLQPIWVDRDQSKSRKTAIQGIVKRVKEDSPNDWPQVCIFPEGTCTNRKSLISFKKGAFYPGVPVQPYLPVYHPSKSEIDNPELYAENVRTVMAKHLGVPKTNLTYEDCKKMLVPDSSSKHPFDILNDILQRISVINKPKPFKNINVKDQSNIFGSNGAINQSKLYIDASQFKEYFMRDYYERQQKTSNCLNSIEDDTLKATIDELINIIKNSHGGIEKIKIMDLYHYMGNYGSEAKNSSNIKNDLNNKELSDFIDDLIRNSPIYSCFKDILGNAVEQCLDDDNPNRNNHKIK